MTVGGAAHAEAVSDDKTPTNPPPFSGHVDMSRIPVHDLAHSADESTIANWKDIEGYLKLGKLKEVCIYEKYHYVCLKKDMSIWLQLNIDFKRMSAYL